MAEALLQTHGEKRPRRVVVAESVGTRPVANVSEYALLRLPLEAFDAHQLREEAQSVHNSLVAPGRRTSARLWK
jgi:hypothetical protein